MALALSGGGFRATAFHLGVVRLLYDARLLHRIAAICAVSGGSLLAVNMEAHWQDYVDYEDPSRIEARLGQVAACARRGIRTQLLCQWLLGLGWFASDRWLGSQRVGLFARAIQAGLIGPTGAPGHQSVAATVHPSAPGVPPVFLLSTDLRDNSCVGFSTNTCIHVVKKSPPEPGSGVSFSAALVEGAATVRWPSRAWCAAYSAAFPGLFPASRLRRAAKGTALEDALLSDGGVFDNLGAKFLQQVMAGSSRARGSSSGLDWANAVEQVLVSDAGAQGESWKSVPAWSTAIVAARRAVGLSLTELGSVTRRGLEGAKHGSHTATFLFATLPGPAGTELGDVLEDSTTAELPRIRTDLNSFSPEEIAALFLLGYQRARTQLLPEIPQNHGKGPAQQIVSDEVLREAAARVAGGTALKGVTRWPLVASGSSERSAAPKSLSEWAHVTVFVLVYLVLSSLAFYWLVSSNIVSFR